ncbi:replication initiation protein [Desertibacillus haloalkaliphilus]|uniref:replication initiation protein n=1 Tax=Desertibacillus haloalkaliphilus TaxID=1328930 RepID=UPI001C253752|nr:replication initiation protein [Desertibacillus haloalkaliphilus]MBU8908124.1 replication initiation protein [Desertibacillus haloalkaliphilus]
MGYQQLSLLENTSTVSPEYWVNQHNTLLQTPNNLTIQERRIIYTLASLIQPEDEDFQIHRIRVKDLADMLGIKEKNFYSKVSKVIKGLRNKEITIKTEHSTLEMKWLASSEYFDKKGMVELEFSRKMAPFLLQLKENYTPFKLRNVLQLRSEYSFKIYELLKQYENLKKRTFTIEELKYYLLIAPDKYKLYGHLKNKVIKKAQDELKEKTDIAFDFEEKRTGNKVTSITFYIKKNSQIIEEVLNDEKLNKDAYALLIRFGLKPSTAKKMVEQYSEKRIKRNINYVLTTKSKNDIDNISGYVYSAIIDDYVGVDDRKSDLEQRKVIESDTDKNIINENINENKPVEVVISEINEFIKGLNNFYSMLVQANRLTYEGKNIQIRKQLKPYLYKTLQSEINMDCLNTINFEDIHDATGREIFREVYNEVFDEV